MSPRRRLPPARPSHAASAARSHAPESARLSSVGRSPISRHRRTLAPNGRDKVGLALICCALVLPSSFALGSQETTATDELGAFSVTYPSEWSAVSTASEGSSQIGLFASGPLEISVVALSRPLDRRESALEPRELLDELVLLTVDNQGALGNQVVDAGRVAPLIDDWPAFSVVATDLEQRKMITCWRFVVDDRLYTLTTMTVNAQASPELGAIVRRVIESFRVLR